MSMNPTIQIFGRTLDLIRLESKYDDQIQLGVYRTPAGQYPRIEVNWFTHVGQPDYLNLSVRLAKDLGVGSYGESIKELEQRLKKEFSLYRTIEAELLG